MPKCKVCRLTYTHIRRMQVVCGKVECAQEYAERKRLKAERIAEKAECADDRKRREKLKSRSDWMREAQAAFNKFIRMRDAGQACISCGRMHEGQHHAGHFLSVGSHPELRFDEGQVFLQCSACNLHLSGNPLAYRRTLVDRFGPAYVEQLEGPHSPKKWTIDELKEIKANYAKRARELA